MNAEEKQETRSQICQFQSNLAKEIPSIFQGIILFDISGK